MKLPTGYLARIADEAARDAYDMCETYGIADGFDSSDEFADYWLTDGAKAWVSGTPVAPVGPDGDNGETLTDGAARAALRAAYDRASRGYPEFYR